MQASQSWSKISLCWGLNKRNRRQLLPQRSSSTEIRDETVAASKPQGAGRLSWPGWGCRLNTFWWTTVRLHASVMSKVSFASCPCAWDMQAQAGLQSDLPLEDKFWSVGSAGMDEPSPSPSTPFFLSEGSRWWRRYCSNFWDISTWLLTRAWGCCPEHLPLSPTRECPAKDKSRYESLQEGTARRFSCSALSSMALWDQRDTDSQSARCRLHVKWLHTAPKWSFLLTRTESLGISQLFMLQKNRDDAEIIFKGASHSSHNESQHCPERERRALFCPSSQPPAERLSWCLVKITCPPCPLPPAVKMPKDQAWEG